MVTRLRPRMGAQRHPRTSAVSAGARGSAEISPQPSIGALDTDISVLERCVPTSLLENGIEDHQPKASAGDHARARSQVNALRTWTTCSGASWSSWGE